MFCLNEEKLSPILHVICLAMVCLRHQDQAFMSIFSGIPQEHLFNLRQEKFRKDPAVVLAAVQRKPEAERNVGPLNMSMGQYLYRYIFSG